MLVFGGTRGVGRLLASGAEAAGHDVTVFARRAPSAADADGPPGRVIVGDAKDRASVTAAVPGHDAVVLSLGPSGADRVRRFIGPATEWVVRAMEDSGVRRLVLVSAVGVGDSRRDAPASVRWLIRPLLGATYPDRDDAEAIVRASRLDWTIVRPLFLTDDAPTGRWRATTDARTVRGPVPRGDVAAFLLGVLERGSHVHEAVAIERA